jgi:hypothetical protein
MRSLALGAALSLALSSIGCRGEDGGGAAELAECGKARANQQATIVELQDELAKRGEELEAERAKLAELEKRLDGGKPERPSRPEVRGDAGDAALYEAFVAALRRSRGSIQSCYQAALKRDGSLQARTLTLDIEVDYLTSGKVRGASFAPRVSGGFETCMKAVAARWVLPAMPRAVTFAYKQSLTPE